MCQSSYNVLAYTAVAFFSGTSQQEDAAPHISHTMAVIVVVWSMLLPSGPRHCVQEESEGSKMSPGFTHFVLTP